MNDAEHSLMEQAVKSFELELIALHKQKSDYDLNDFAELQQEIREKFVTEFGTTARQLQLEESISEGKEFKELLLTALSDMSSDMRGAKQAISHSDRLRTHNDGNGLDEKMLFGIIRPFVIMKLIKQIGEYYEIPEESLMIVMNAYAKSIVPEGSVGYVA